MLFAPSETQAFGRSLSACLDLPLASHEEREFDGGEHKLRSLVSVRGRSVYLVQSLCGDSLRSANDRLCRLLFFAGSLKEAGAASVTACIPYLAYARKEVRTKARDPVTSRYVAQLIEAIGICRIIVLEAHNRAAVDNAFRIESLHLEATASFVAHFAERLKSLDVCVLSPDIGGVKRARHFKELLDMRLGRSAAFAFMDKKRSEGRLSGDTLVGDVRGRGVILLDDLISSGSTILRSVDACRAAGAARVDVAATHCAFNPQARRLFEPGGPDSVVSTDSIALDSAYACYVGNRLQILSAAPLFAEAIRRLETGGSLSELAGL